MNKPNVLLIYPDEMRFDSTSFEKNATCKTPHIDDMAKDSAYFAKAYSSFPLCCPFRASMMTGKYAHKTGMWCNHIPIPLDQQFLPGFMKEAGYRTGWVGKWHLNGGDKYKEVPEEYQLGFDEFTGYSRGHHYLNSVYYKGADPQPYKSDKYEPEYQTDQIIDFMSRSVDDGQPFLGMVCYGLPHHPVEMSPDYYKNMYQAEDVVLPSTVPPWKRESSKEYRAKYYGMVTCVDDQIGRINKFLEEKGIKDNTVFIFVSDHGDMCSEHGMEDKYVCHEASAHVPYMIQYPDMVKEGVKINQIVDPAITIVPTILDLCGVEVPEYMPGKSLKGAMKQGEDETLPDYCYYQMIQKDGKALLKEPVLSEQRPFGERGFRTKDVVYVEKWGAPFKMYDLTKDIQEEYNCVDNHEYILEVRKNHEILKQLMEKVDDSWENIVDDFPEDYQSHGAAEFAYEEIYPNAIYDEK